MGEKNTPSRGELLKDLEMIAAADRLSYLLPPYPSKDTILRDMESQWKDHFHMRDQSWKTLTHTAAFFLGTIGLEIKGGIGNEIMSATYFTLLVVALLGWAVVDNHRVRQKQKFDLITKYEKLLGLYYGIKEPILNEKKYNSLLLRRFSVAGFIEIMQILVAFVALLLLFRKICPYLKYSALCKICRGLGL